MKHKNASAKAERSEHDQQSTSTKGHARILRAGVLDVKDGSEFFVVQKVLSVATRALISLAEMFFLRREIRLSSACVLHGRLGKIRAAKDGDPQDLEECPEGIRWQNGEGSQCVYFREGLPRASRLSAAWRC
jgi:hypothetical protein